MFNLTSCTPIGQCSVRTPKIALRGTVLRASSLLDLLSFVLDQKDLAITQVQVIDQRLLSSREVQMSSAITQKDNGDPTRTQDVVIGQG